jgi:hypothetical protein
MQLLKKPQRRRTAASTQTTVALKTCTKTTNSDPNHEIRSTVKTANDSSVISTTTSSSLETRIILKIVQTALLTALRIPKATLVFLLVASLSSRTTGTMTRIRVAGTRKCGNTSSMFAL